jgi:hypothetical protein
VALHHPGNAVAIPLTVGLDPWETHQLGATLTQQKERYKIVVELQII